MSERELLTRALNCFISEYADSLAQILSACEPTGEISYDRRIQQLVEPGEEMEEVHCCPMPRNGNSYWTGSGARAIASKGLFIRSHRSRYVNRFHLRKATRFDSDQLNLDLN